MELPLCNGTTSLLSHEALPIIVQEMNSRLMANFARVDKFLTALKEFYQWPSLRVEATISQKYSKLERWGHVGAFVRTTSTEKGNSLHILGGYGVDIYSGNNRKCQRNLPNLVLNESLEARSSHASLGVDRVHAAGHYFSCSSTNSANFIITGGRKSPQDTARPFIQEFVFNEHEFHLLESSIEQGDVPSPRWGHTMTEIGDKTFFIFGGRDEKEIFGDGYIVKKTESTVWHWEKVFDFHNDDGKLKPCFFHAACQVSGHVVGDESMDEVPRYAVLIHGGCISLDEPIACEQFAVLYPLERAWKACLDAPSPCLRFGHTLTHLGFKSILLTGGVAADIKYNKESSLLILDYYVDNSGYIDIKLRKKLSIDGSLPCSSCRAHHGAFLDSKGKFIYLLGGGSPVLGFGTHHCVSAIIEFAHDKSGLPGAGDAKVSKVRHLLSSDAGHKKDISPLQLVTDMIAGSNSMKDVRCILVSKSKVKEVKSFLENNKSIDKSVRICKVDASAEIQIVARIDKSSVNLEASEEEKMAIPLDEGFYNEMMNAPPDHSFWKFLNSNYAIFSFQRCPKAKAESVNRYTFVSAFIEAFCDKWSPFRDNMLQKGGIIPTTGAKLRLEIVGDIMVIPEDVLCVSPWNGEGVEGQQINMLSELWTGLATCFGVKKVARKAKIDSGMKRESKVRLLLPPLGLPEGTGPGSPGWTTVIENGISFGFDITRVMFCSGNCTERMRVGTFKNAHGECIVDLYAGIGYYTIPYLVHAGAAIVHACEWNDNSVLALRHNLKSAGIHSDRCIIYHGDNRLEDTQAALAGKADRVSLGLLPSSIVGWPLAVNALKNTGGKLHVHENVHNAEISTWVDDACQKFKALFLKNRKIHMDIKCEHVERVKSYAPKISHIVVDLVCTPIQAIE